MIEMTTVKYKIVHTHSIFFIVLKANEEGRGALTFRGKYYAGNGEFEVKFLISGTFLRKLSTYTLSAIIFALQTVPYFHLAVEKLFLYMTF